MPRDDDQNIEQTSYQLIFLQIIVSYFFLYYFIYSYLHGKSQTKPLPKLLALNNEDNTEDLLEYLKRTLQLPEDDLSAEFRSALKSLNEKLTKGDKPLSYKAALADFQKDHPEYAAILICALRLKEFKDATTKKNHEKYLNYETRTTLIDKLQKQIEAEYKESTPLKSRIATIGWALQYLHRLDDFSLQLGAAEKGVNFEGSNTLNAFCMHFAIHNTYSQLADALENDEVRKSSTHQQLQFFDSILHDLFNTIRKHRNSLTESSYRPFVGKIDQILNRPTVPLFLKDIEDVAPVLVSKHPHLKPKVKDDYVPNRRYWYSFGVTVEESSIYHGVVVLSHQDDDTGEIFIDQGVGYYSGVFTIPIIGQNILKPFTQTDAKLKPEKINDMVLTHMYKHWGITENDFKIVNDAIKNMLFKKGRFNSFTKNCKHTNLDFLKLIGIFSPAIESSYLGFLPSFSNGLRRGTMREVAHVKDGVVVGRDKFNCAPMIWDIDTVEQLRQNAEPSPALLAVQMQNTKKGKLKQN